MVDRSVGVVVTRHNDYTVYIKNDGFDYLALWTAFINGAVENVVPIRIVDDREVYQLSVDGREFILKIDRYVPRRLEKKIRWAVFGPFFSKWMRAVNSAVRQGCRVVPDFFLVAEKKQGLLVTESYVLQEFIDGKHFKDVEAIQSHADDVIRAVKELHAHNLAHCDLNADNMLLTEEGVRFIDLSCTGSVFGGKGKDIIRLWERFNIRVPLASFPEKLTYWYTALKFAFQDYIHGQRRL